ncbi:MAG: mechanosensitive ion channel family protein, partial [Pseudomonadota bacterium]
MLDVIIQWLEPIGLSEDIALGLAIAAASLAILCLSVMAYLVMRFVVVAGLSKAIMRGNSRRDDLLSRLKVFSRLSHVAPAVVIYALAPTVFERFPAAVQVIETVNLVYLTVMIVLFLDALMSAGLMIYRTFEVSKTAPITSFVQVAKLLLYFLGAITVVSLIIGESPLVLFAGLGAMTAVLMLIFQDSIL